MNFVFFMLTPSPVLSIPSFHTFDLAMHSSSESAITTRLSAYRSPHGTPVRNWPDRASSTSMKSKGLRTDPWCTLTPTPNSSLYWPLTRMWLLTSVNMPWMTHTVQNMREKCQYIWKDSLKLGYFGIYWQLHLPTVMTDILLFWWINIYLILPVC